MASEHEEVETQEEEEDLTINNLKVLEKYKNAAEVAQKALELCLNACEPEKKIVDVIIQVETFIQEQIAKFFAKNKKVTKGLAFPICVSVNNTVGHFSPFSTDNTVLNAGDVVKVDLGVHIDGYVTVVAHTKVLSATGAKADESTSTSTDRVADLLTALHYCSEAVLRYVRPNVPSTKVTEIIGKIAATYGVNPVVGVLSHNLDRFVIDGKQVIMNRADEKNEMKVDEFQFEPNTVYSFDIVLSTGEGKPRELDTPTTVYKRNTNTTYQLKMNASRQVLSQVDKQYPVFPFSLRAIDEKIAKFAIKECKAHDLVFSYPVLYEREGDKVAQEKFTVLITEKRVEKLTGISYESVLKSLKSEKKIEDEEIRTLLSSPIYNAGGGSNAKKNAKKKAKKKEKEAKGNDDAPAAE